MTNLHLDSFNAKYLELKRLVETFVPSEHFKRVAQNTPVLLVGARGSGKTTLLRMLGNDALSYWDGPGASEFKENITYEGVYVPADSVWGDMIRGLGEVDPTLGETFACTAFSTNIFQAVINALEISLRNHEFPQGADNTEKKISSAFKEISKILKLNLKSYSFYSFRSALNQRQNELGELQRKIQFSDCQFNSGELAEDNPYFFIPLDTALESIFDAFDSALGRKNHRWAILLDEFEIAPLRLQNEIFNKLRSSRKKHIYKIALVPCGEHLSTEVSSSGGNDYEVVELWNKGVKEADEFCKNIVKSRFNIDSPGEFFGKSKYVENNSTSDEENKEHFLALMDKDPSFKAYVERKKINIDRTFDNKAKSDEIRKITPIVAFRNLKKDLGGDSKRRDILPEFYAGWQAIVKISEGNPRWLMSTVTTLTTSDTNESGSINLMEQARKINQTTAAFKSMIDTTALKNNMGITTNTPPSGIIETIGKFFSDIHIKEDFSADVKGSFVVDSKINTDIQRSLEIALNHGAIISLEEDQDIWGYKSLVGKRFRLSYLYAPVYWFLMRNDKKVNLSNLLANRHSKRKTKAPSQEDMFR